MSVTTRLKSLKINYLTQSQYDTALDNEEINENELYLTPDNNVDFVVETGTSGIWTYRKWNSGIAECWGKIGLTQTSNGSYSTPWVNNLFNNVPIVTVNNWYGAADDPHRAARATVVTDGSSNSECVLYFRTPDGTEYGKILSSYYFAVNINAIGTWK